MRPGRHQTSCIGHRHAISTTLNILAIKAVFELRRFAHLQLEYLQETYSNLLILQVSCLSEVLMVVIRDVYLSDVILINSCLEGIFMG